jgi:hypothetical protein
MLKRWSWSGLIPLLILSALALGLAAPLSAQAQSAGLATNKDVRFEASMGYQTWDALSDLEPAGGGSFRGSGFGIGGAAHWLMKRTDRMDLLFGVDLYTFTNSSTVFHYRDDLEFRALQLTPSVRFSFDDGVGPRFLLGFGVGYYEADTTEVSTYWWGLVQEETVWDDNALGGYISFDFDFPRRKNNTENGIFFSARIHKADLGIVRDERPSIFGQTLGPNAGSLSDPYFVLHVGYQWFN